MTARFGPFAVDSDQRRLSRDVDDGHLTPKAFDLLQLLVKELRGALDNHNRSSLIVPAPAASR